jgi:two-component system, LuxR family, sensor kinase FixL
MCYHLHMSIEIIGAIEAVERGSAHTALKNPDVGPRLIKALEQTKASGIDAMGSALAHELNQPLAALTIYLQSLRRQCAKLPDTAPIVIEMVEKSLREAERAGEIVRRMRRFSARSEPDRKPMDMNSMAEESLELSLLGTSKAIQIERDFETNSPLIMCDAVQIRQIMVNLLKNAVEATSRKPLPRIFVTTSVSDGFAHFRVSDNGPGITPSMAGRLFKAFETSKPQGMGLGLAISKMIAQNHHGDLVLDTGGSGSGACFGLKLPTRKD